MDDSRERPALFKSNPHVTHPLYPFVFPGAAIKFHSLEKYKEAKTIEMRELITHIVVIALLLGGFGTYLFWPKKSRLKNEWQYSLVQEFMKLKRQIDVVHTKAGMNYLEEQIDDMYNEYKGKVNDHFLTGYTNELYRLISNKGIELA